MNNRQQQRSRSQAPLLIVILASVIVVSVLALLLLKGIPTRSAPGSEAAVLPGGGIVQLFLSENGKTILALRQDGRVTPVPISGIAEDSLSAPLAKTAEWTEITALARCWGWILGLRADGTAVAAPTNDIAAYAESAPDMYRTELEKQQQTLAQLAAWHDVVKVVSGVRYAVGIRADGTVATFGEDPAEIHGGPFFSELSRWTDIKKIEVGAWPAGEYCVGLRNDGTLLVCGSVIDSAGWTGPTEHIADFDCSGIRMAVLTEEGRILDGYLGSNGVVVEEPFKESGFRQVVICRGPVGLRPNGTLASSQPELAALADVEHIEARHNNGNSLLTVYHHDGSAALPFFREDDVISEAGGWTDLASLCLHDDFAIQGRDGKPGPQHYILGLRKDGSVVSAGIDFAALYGDALSYFAPSEAVSPAALPQQDAGSPVVETPETFELLPIDTVYSDSGKFALEPGWSDQPIAYSYAMPQVAGIFADSARINAEIRALLNDYNYISTAPKNTHILHSQGREIPFSDYLPYETVNETGNIYIVNMDWNAEQFGRILSVRVSTRLYGYGKWVEPETVRSWCLDMDTGLLLSGPEILRAAGISQDDFIKMASFAMETQCSAGWQWPAGNPDEERYDEMQRAIRTTLQANSYTKLCEKGIYLFEDGTLGIDAWISDGSAYGYECFLRLVPEPELSDSDADPAQNRSRIVQILAEDLQVSAPDEQGFSLGLRKDGTVVSAGNLPESTRAALNSWHSITRLEKHGLAYLVGYRDDGPIALTGCIDLAAYGFDGKTRIDWTQENFEDWTDVTSVVISYNYIAGLRKDGTVLTKAKGLTDRMDVENFSAAGWRDVVSIYDYNGDTLIGLKADGTVVATNSYWLDYHWNKGNAAWDADIARNKVVGIETAFFGLLAFRENGELLGASYIDGSRWADAGSWNNVTEIVIGSDSVFGLRNDGTVAAAHLSEDPRLEEVRSWTDIVQLSMTGKNRYLPVGLCRDGTVRAVASYHGQPYGEWDVQDWQGVEKLFTGTYYTLGLRGDGSVLATGGEFGTLDGIEEAETWSDIVDLACSETHILALRSDGTVLALGNNGSGQCNVSSWGR